MRDKIKEIFKWLYPGIGVKRWILLSAFGVFLVVIGSNYLQTEEFLGLRTLDLIVVISGIIILILAIKNIVRSFVAAFSPSSKGAQLVDMLYYKKQLSRGPKVVAVGGGTGLSVLLAGLKDYTSNISAIVTVAPGV